MQIIKVQAASGWMGEFRSETVPRVGEFVFFPNQQYEVIRVSYELVEGVAQPRLALKAV